jgi:hypothetical protein
MLFQLKKLPEIINLTRFLKSFWILYIDQIIVYYAFYSKLTFYIIKDRCQKHALKVFRSPVWLLLHKLSSPHGFLNYALFCLSFCLRLNLTPVNYLTTRRPNMAKCQGSIFSFFGNVNGPTQQKNNKIIWILNVLFI